MLVSCILSTISSLSLRTSTILHDISIIEGALTSFFSLVPKGVSSVLRRIRGLAITFFDSSQAFFKKFSLMYLSGTLSAWRLSMTSLLRSLGKLQCRTFYKAVLVSKYLRSSQNLQSPLDSTACRGFLFLSHSEGASLLSKVFRRYRGRSRPQNDVSPPDHRSSNVPSILCVLIKARF